MNHNVISIIIPVYNVESYIEKCLISVINQTYTKDIECVLVDDCSQDASILIAEHIISTNKSDIDFKIIHHTKNKGLSAARNTGIENAKGEWLYFLDSDDWITEDCIESIWTMVKKYPQCDVIISSTESENEWVKREALINRHDIPDYTEDRLWIMDGLLSRPVKFSLSAWNKLYSTQFIKENSLSFLEGFIREDEIWSFHYSKYVQAVAFNKRNTYHYRVNPSGIVKTNKQYTSASFSLDIVSHYLANITPLGKEVQLQLISRMLLDAYMQLHNDNQMLVKCQVLFKRLFRVSGLKRKIGCLVLLFIPHWLVCKKPIYSPSRKYLFGIPN